LRCACECRAQRLLALAFSGDGGVYFAAIGGGGNAGPLLPRPELCLRLGSPALALSCSTGEREVLLVLTETELLCFGAAAPGGGPVPFGPQPVARLLLSALPAPSAAALAAEGAGGAEGEAGGGGEEEEEE
jgi:hypothetical protein